MSDFLLQNWNALLTALLAFAAVVVALTPTEKDNKILSYINSFVSLFTKRKNK